MMHGFKSQKIELHAAFRSRIARILNKRFRCELLRACNPFVIADFRGSTFHRDHENGV